MNISDKGLLEIAEREGIVPAPYLDSVGVWTFGIGHTAKAGPPKPKNMTRGMPADIDAAIDRALALFRRDVQVYVARVNRAIKVPLEQHEFDALVDFDFNTGGIFRATLTKRINAGDPDAADSFMGWSKPPEIIPRRRASMNLFRTGNYDANGDLIPVYSVDMNGKLGPIIRYIRGRDLLPRLRPAEVYPEKPQDAPESPLPIDLPDDPGMGEVPAGGRLSALFRAILALLKGFKR